MHDNYVKKWKENLHSSRLCSVNIPRADMIACEEILFLQKTRKLYNMCLTTEYQLNNEYTLIDNGCQSWA